MPNIKKNDKIRVFSISMHQSVLTIIDKVAEENKTSRSKVIEAVMRGWIDASILHAIKETKEKGEEQNESNNSK